MSNIVDMEAANMTTNLVDHGDHEDGPGDKPHVDHSDDSFGKPDHADSRDL